MWNEIRKLLSGAAREATSDIDPKLAAATLLVEAALADGIYAKIEETMIRRALVKAFDLKEEACAALLEEAETVAEHSIDHYAFTTRIKALPAGQRRHLVRALWEVVFADGEESPFEDSFVRKIVPLLAVSDRESRFARQEALSRAHMLN
jgi:uncharacterized tellurite resistance protein B-like protein